MSESEEELSKKIEALIGEHFAANGGGFPTSFFFFANGVDMDGEQIWCYRVMPGQGMQTTLGILDFSNKFMDHEARRYMEEIGGC